MINERFIESDTMAVLRRWGTPVNFGDEGAETVRAPFRRMFDVFDPTAPLATGWMVW